MKNKKLVLIFGIVVMAFSCTQKKEYVISGNAPEELNEQYIYMMDYDNNQRFDSALVSSGKFSFTGPADPARIARLEDQSRQYYSNLILEAGTTTVYMDDRLKTSGTVMNEAFRDYQSEIELFYEEAGAERQAIQTEFASDPVMLRQKMEEFSERASAKEKEINMRYLKANTDNGIAKFLFPGMTYGMAPAEVDALFAELGENIKQSERIQRVMQTNENIKKTQEGAMFTDFTIENGNSDETSVSLSDYVGKGKYVLVDFWASWCGPCIGEFPVLKEVYKQYKGDKFEMVGVAVWEDKRDNTIEAVKQHEIIWPVIFDAQTIPTDIYGISGIPQIILFGPDGTIIARNLRGEAIKAKLAELL